MLWKKIAEALLDESDSVAYVADMHTFELQYMNAHTKKLLGLHRMTNPISVRSAINYCKVWMSHVLFVRNRS